MVESASKLLELLTYIEQVEKMKTKPVFIVPTDSFCAFQHELKGLPEVRFNLQDEGDDIWLRLPRLQEMSPPELGVELGGWVTLPKDISRSPELKSEVPRLENRIVVALEHLSDHPEVQEQFDWYVENQWQPWVTGEMPRRRTIDRYKALFTLHQTIAAEGTETPLELVWGIGHAVWKKPGKALAVRHPLLVQACEVRLDEKSGFLEVRPRDVDAKLELDCYAELDVPGVTRLEAYWRSAQAAEANRVNPFEPSTFEAVLRAAVSQLDPTGSYQERSEDLVPSVPGEHLKVTNTWVLFARKRSADVLLEDIRRLKKNLESGVDIPPVLKAFVEIGGDEVRVQPEQAFRGLSTSESTPGAFELFFPLPYNQEQVSIVQKLEHNHGVVVQGPPGTGKTHTIANIVCHYLAQGKRVLVTAKGDQALSVLQEKLPDRIRPLSVALLSDESGGRKQFEHSIQTIASAVASLIPSRASASIAAAEAKLDQLHAQISTCDRTVTEYAGKHMRHYTFQGQEVTPEVMAKTVLADADQHAWFDDSPPAAPHDGLPFNDADISALRDARLTVGDSLNYLGCRLPAADEFPPATNILALHRDLLRARAIDASVSQGTLLPLIDEQFETYQKAEGLSAYLNERFTLRAKLAGLQQAWLGVLERKLWEMGDGDPLLPALTALLDNVKTLEQERRSLVPRAVDVPVDAELNADCLDALERLVDGRNAFMLPFGKSDARQLIGVTRVMGAVPASVKRWKDVQTVLRWREQARTAVARWKSLAQEFGLPVPEGTVEVAFKSMAVWQDEVADVRTMLYEYQLPLHARIQEVFGANVADRVFVGAEPYFASLQSSLQAHLDKGRLGYAMKRVTDLSKKLDECSGSVVDQMKSFFAEYLGDAEHDEAILQSMWVALERELTRLADLRGALTEIERVTALIEDAGATRWSSRLRTVPATGTTDPVTPGSWLEAWNWRQAGMFLERIDGHDRLRKLFEERRTLATTLARTYQDLVAEKTWLGVHRNSPDRVRQALQAYMNAVQAMGAGTGVRAQRHRKSARAAMTQAYQAVPCWVLPTWRVSETIPAEVGLFDLVVIDEASQSDIWALPALLRGKKLLVVGDHKQVSPSAVGTSETSIVALTQRFLANQPHGDNMTPDKSVYDLARVVFAGNSVMLREHFRCVPAIIEFSNREFYKGDIQPLRLPKGNERLDPPLVDVFVKGAFRKGDTNPAEAQAIVDEIKLLLADGQFVGRTIGVVTLMGNAQAPLIHSMIANQIAPADIVARKIMVGAPPVFQGNERDIMMVSMVLVPGNAAAATRADFEQRFNVAFSRARDRMYLFRSVPDGTFREESLNGKVMAHFKRPFAQNARQVAMLRERCESGFEFEMFDALVQRGYRIEPQVQVAAYRLDFVVEGKEGRRLAVECDGDRFHGPGQWSDDMARQRVLERAGWTFWRCFASTFARRKEEVLEELVATLTRHGIEPIGSALEDNTVWVHAKAVDPLGTENFLNALDLDVPERA